MEYFIKQKMRKKEYKLIQLYLIVKKSNKAFQNIQYYLYINSLEKGNNKEF